MIVRIGKRTVGCVAWLMLVLAPLGGADEPPIRPIPESNVTTQHLDARLSLDIENESIGGTVTHTLEAKHDGLRSVMLHAEQLEIHKVRLQDQPLEFETRDGELIITLDREYASNEVLEVTVHYTAQPVRGLYFVKPTPARPQTPLTIWTQGEPEDTRYWLPCWDYPNQMTTTEMRITVPEDLFAIGNGQLKSDTIDPEAGTRTLHWRMDQPHVTYLISLVVGRFREYRIDGHRVPMVAYAPPERYHPESMRRAYGRTRQMMDFFERRIGVAYPWPKYTQVSVPEFRFGGMENISATTLYEFALQPPGAAAERSMDGLVAHELAHQWWGNLVTCRDWSHLWLNEGFATYFDALFTEEHRGGEAFAYQMRGNRRSGIEVDRKTPRPIVWQRYRQPMEMFDARAYPKGASVLHMLRGLLGDDVFFRALGLYAQRHAHEPVVTDDLRRVLEQVSEHELDWFFQQWCHQAGSPQLACQWSWDADAGGVRLEVRQTQATSDVVPLFRLPTEALLVYPDGTSQRHAIEIDRAEHGFQLPANREPAFVLIDPDHWLLATFDWERPWDEWQAVLAQGPHILDRAAAALSLPDVAGDDPMRQQQATAWLVERFHHETFPWLKADLVASLGKLGHDTALPTLVTATRDPAPSVRAAAVKALREFPDDDTAAAAAVTMWHRETAPVARSEALETLVQLKVPGWQTTLLRALDVASYRETVPQRAANLLAKSKLPEATARLLDKTESTVAWNLRSTAIQALGHRIDEPEVVERLLILLDDDNYFARRAAVRALARSSDQGVAEQISARLRDAPPRDPHEQEQWTKAIDEIRQRPPEPEANRQAA